MKYLIKQKVFSIPEKFYIYDEFGEELYLCKGEFFTFASKLHLYDKEGNEILYIKEKLFSLLQKIYVYKDGKEVSEIIKKLSLFKPYYDIYPQKWEIKGDFFEHEYQIISQNNLVATISKKWFSWGDTYNIDVSDAYDDLIVLAIVLAIDIVNNRERNSSAN